MGAFLESNVHFLFLHEELLIAASVTRHFCETGMWSSKFATPPASQDVRRHLLCRKSCRTPVLIPHETIFSSLQKSY